MDHPLKGEDNAQWRQEFRQLSTLVLYTELAQLGAQEHGVSTQRFLTGLIAAAENRKDQTASANARESLSAIKDEARAMVRAAVQDFKTQAKAVKKAAKAQREVDAARNVTSVYKTLPRWQGDATD